MAQPRSQSRGATSTTSSRPHSTHSLSHQAAGGGEGPYLPPTGQAPTDSDYDFCNSFWVTPQRSRRDARDQDSEERDWGKEGYDTVLARVKSGTKVLDELRSIFKERASIEEDYSKRLTKLSKSSFGTGETGHMERAIITLKQELDTTAKSHHDLASLLKQQENMVNDFMAKRDGARKTQQGAIEKTWKNMNNQREHVVKAKSKYETDAIQINSLHAQASLLQGRELDKATLKMDKVQQTVVVNERDYRNFVAVLKETTMNWNMAWKTFCDLVQDQEEERLEFIKGRMWDWANAQSTIAMAEDESAERTRTALEQCEPKLDIRIFVQRYATGNCIPDPLPFVDASKSVSQPKQGYKTAKFARSSTRIPGVKHSPSAVNDIARALHQQQQPVQTQPTRSNSGQPAQQPARASSAGGGISRPASRSGNPPIETSNSTSFVPPAAQAATPARAVVPPPAETASRFAVSPNAALRQTPLSPPGEQSQYRAVSPAPGSGRPGHINASAFQNRPASIVAPAQASPAQYQPSPSTSPRKAVQASAPPLVEDDNDDPLLQALKVLQSTPAPVASPRSSRMSPHPASSASVTNGNGNPISSSRPVSSYGNPPSRPGTTTGHRPQSSLGQNISAPAQSRSRPTSPAPVAAMMQPPATLSEPPSSSSQTQQHSMSVPYGQPFPGSQNSNARPASRGPAPNGQQPNRNSLASPASVPNFPQTQRPTSPGGGFAGVGARGRSPSPQPYIPESLRPRSPAVAHQIHMQMQSQNQTAQARPTSTYGAQPPQQQAYPNRSPSAVGSYTSPAQPYSQPHPYGGRSPAPAPVSPYAQTASPAPGSIRPASIVGGAPPSPGYPAQQQQHHGYSAPPPVTSQHFASPQTAHPPYAQHAPPAPAPHTLHQQQQQQAPPAALTATSTYPYPAQSPSHSHHVPYSAPPAQPYQPSTGSVASVNSGSNVPVQRTPSMHSGVSQAAPYHHQQHPSPVTTQPIPRQQQQQQPVRAASVASVRAGSVPPPPPTGQYTDQGQPIIFYVNALFDYRAASNEEFSFSAGDVIAVTATDPDGWWQGQRVGDNGPSKLFPSNFTELLS
ncbi:uncharacterized protein JCM15063_001401 [Sporobolomyces koalae]|uniref:uncharacterized protein n=1 Tax=Sporobolomyces koalae TaxID=500713 RepID=UPI00317776DB